MVGADPPCPASKVNLFKPLMTEAADHFFTVNGLVYSVNRWRERYICTAVQGDEVAVGDAILEQVAGSDFGARGAPSRDEADYRALDERVARPDGRRAPLGAVALVRIHGVGARPTVRE